MLAVSVSAGTSRRSSELRVENVAVVQFRRMENNDSLRQLRIDLGGAEEDIDILFRLFDTLVDVLVAGDADFEDKFLAVLDAQRSSDVNSARKVQRAYDTFKG